MKTYTCVCMKTYTFVYVCGPGISNQVTCVHVRTCRVATYMYFCELQGFALDLYSN